MKKLYFGMVISFVLFLLSVAYAETTTGTYEDLSYSIIDDEVIITDCKYSATEVTIPNEIEGCRVTSIGSSAFSGCTSLTEIIIPDSVTSIGDYAFYNCSGLIEIMIPENITSIGSRAFGNCSNLRTIYYNAISCNLEVSKYSQDELCTVFSGSEDIEIEKIIFETK